MAETTIKRGRGRPKKEKLFRNITLGIFHQPSNYFRPVQVAQFNIAEKTGDFEMKMVNTDPSVSRPSMSGLAAFLNSGLPRYNSTDEKTGAIRDIYRENSFDDCVDQQGVVELHSGDGLGVVVLDKRLDRLPVASAKGAVDLLHYLLNLIHVPLVLANVGA